MATVLENEAAWSTTAATNANVDTGIVWTEGQDAATVNNSARGMMAARRKAALDQGGALVAGGSPNALTVNPTNQVLSAAHLMDGMRLMVRAAAANTSAAVTFAPDGLTAAPIKRADGGALIVGSITAGMALDLVYNAGSSEWRCVNINPANAWTVYTPTVSSSTGPPTSYASAAYWTQIGKTILIRINVSITVNGTATGALFATLPAAATATGAYGVVLAGRERIFGKMLQGDIQAGSAAVTILNYDNSYPGGNGTTCIVSGAYEVA